VNRWKSDWDELSDQELEVLGVDELRRLAAAAYMVGRNRESVDAWYRAHTRLLEAGDPEGACRSLFWLLLAIGEDDVSMAPQMGGHLARIRRLVEEHHLGELEQSYLWCYAAIDTFMSGDHEAGLDLWSQISQVGRAYSDPDIWAFGTQGQGRSLICVGRVREGTALLDELLVAIESEELSPAMAGWAYCSCMIGCGEAFDLRRAISWTRSAMAWADGQSDLEAYTGVCLLNRSRVRRMAGAWDDALDDVERACSKLSEDRIHYELGDAYYQRGELMRLRGDHPEADESYGLASRYGHDPQPGMALLRLAQGKAEAARAALTRALGETAAITRRGDLLPAFAEVLLTVGDLTAADVVCHELDELADKLDSSQLRAEALGVRGRIDLARDEPRTALTSLRAAHRLWHDLEAPFASARLRVHLAAACAALGDTESAELERTSARETFAEIGARDELAALGTGDKASTPLTEREIDVVRKVAAGLSNRAVAKQLHISEKTVASHLSHIFTKLDVGNRAAVTAYYYEQLGGNQ
jgi:DNA-binding CsgD family transcriptional regulator